MYAIIKEYKDNYLKSMLDDIIFDKIYVITDISQIEEKTINGIKWCILHTPQGTVKLHTTYCHIKIYFQI